MRLQDFVWYFNGEGTGQTVTIGDKKKTKVELRKVDEYTGEPLPDVQFTIIGPYNCPDGSPQVVTTTRKTDNNGYIRVTFDYEGDYYFTEDNVGPNWQYEATIINEKHKLNPGTNTITKYNDKKFINISGKVFEDNPTGTKRKFKQK